MNSHVIQNLKISVFVELCFGDFPLNSFLILSDFPLGKNSYQRRETHQRLHIMDGCVIICGLVLFYAV